MSRRYGYLSNLAYVDIYKGGTPHEHVEALVTTQAGNVPA